MAIHLCKRLPLLIVVVAIVGPAAAVLPGGLLFRRREMNLVHRLLATTERILARSHELVVCCRLGTRGTRKVVRHVVSMRPAVVPIREVL